MLKLSQVIIVCLSFCGLKVLGKYIDNYQPLNYEIDFKQWIFEPLDINSNDLEEDLGSAWERSGLFEGDIMVSSNNAKNVINDPMKRWTLPIPVYINGSEFDSDQLEVIQEGMQEIEKKTCVRFRQYKEPDPSYIAVRSNNKGCWSQVGRQDGGQIINLQEPGCIHHGIVSHEFLHALGLYHQQSSPDRDQFVTIYWGNITAGREGNFKKYNSVQAETLGEPYDYGSLMHYGTTAFSKDRESLTIQPKIPNAKIGQRKAMSASDAAKVNRMYSCDSDDGDNEKEDCDKASRACGDANTSVGGLQSLINKIFSG